MKHKVEICKTVEQTGAGVSRVSDSGPRGPGFDPQLGCSSLWP